ncbi:MAG TPA: histone deacetylase [Acidobacteriota bacterium]
MPTAFFYDDLYLKHDAGAFHPENPERLRAIIRGLREAELWDRLIHVSPVEATKEQILLVHTLDLFEFVRAASLRGSFQVDPDTHISRHSFDAALLAAGAAVRAVSGIMENEFSNAFAAVRPPGHHATPDHAMGFCLFNNIAIAARLLIQQFKLKRVLIVDWDVHHGNGTQDIFWNDPSVIYLSLHKKYHYPGTGWEDETGSNGAEGTKINYPITDGSNYMELFRDGLAKAEKFRPEFILISCGFDAHENDPLGNLGLTNEMYAELTRIVFEFAGKFDHQRVFSILEGGYDYDALAKASATHVQVLLNHS